VAEKDIFMAKRIHAYGKTFIQARYNITGGCDTEKKHCSRHLSSRNRQLKGEIVQATQSCDAL